MKTVSLLLLTLTLVSSICLARGSGSGSGSGGDETHNGAGLAEQNLTYARVQLPKLLQACLKFQCADLAQVNELLQAQSREQEKLEFVELPSFENYPDGAARFVRTDSEVGSTLQVNLQDLYKNGLPASVEDGVRALTIEYARHLRLSFESSKTISDKLALLTHQFHVVSVANSLSQSRLRLMVWQHSEFATSVSVFDSETETSLHQQIQTNLICPGHSTADENFQMTSGRWEDSKTYDTRDASQPVVWSTSILYHCDSTVVRADLQLLMKFHLYLDGQRIDDAEWQKREGVELRQVNPVLQSVVLSRVRVVPAP